MHNGIYYFVLCSSVIIFCVYATEYAAAVLNVLVFRRWREDLLQYSYYSFPFVSAFWCAVSHGEIIPCGYLWFRFIFPAYFHFSLSRFCIRAAVIECGVSCILTRSFYFFLFSFFWRDFYIWVDCIFLIQRSDVLYIGNNFISCVPLIYIYIISFFWFCRKELAFYNLLCNL